VPLGIINVGQPKMLYIWIEVSVFSLLLSATYVLEGFVRDFVLVL